MHTYYAYTSRATTLELPQPHNNSGCCTAMIPLDSCCCCQAKRDSWAGERGDSGSREGERCCCYGTANSAVQCFYAWKYVQKYNILRSFVNRFSHQLVPNEHNMLRNLLAPSVCSTQSLVVVVVEEAQTPSAYCHRCAFSLSSRCPFSSVSVRVLLVFIWYIVSSMSKIASSLN